MGRLTVKGIAKLTRPGRYGDGNGLYLLVTAGKRKDGTPTGRIRRSWVQRITVVGRRVDRGIGSVAFVTLAQARDVAFRNRLAARHQGIDPFAGRASRTPTFAQAAAKVAEVDRARLVKSSATANAAAMEKYALPVLGDRRVDQIGRADVLKVLTPIWTEMPAIARKVRGLLRGVLAWAVAHGHVEHNPVDAISGALPAMPVVKDHMRALPWQEVPEAFRKIDQCGASSLSARLALRFLVLTACRRSEVRGARWDGIDLDAREWRIRAERMKAGREHRVPLSDAAVAVLDAVKPLRRGDLVFPSPTGSGMLAAVTMQNVLNAAGYAGRATVHGFRSSFRDWAAEQTDADHAVMELSLAHQVGSAVERSYARSDLFEKRRALMDEWASFVTPEREREVWR